MQGAVDFWCFLFDMIRLPTIALEAHMMDMLFGVNRPMIVIKHETMRVPILPVFPGAHMNNAVAVWGAGALP